MHWDSVPSLAIVNSLLFFSFWCTPQIGSGYEYDCHQPDWTRIVHCPLGVTVTGWYRLCLLALDSAERSFGLWSRETPHLAELPCVTSIFSTGRRLLTWSAPEKVGRFGICWAAGEVLRWRGEKLPLFRVLEWLQHIRRFTFSCSYSANYARRQSVVSC